MSQSPIKRIDLATAKLTFIFPNAASHVGFHHVIRVYHEGYSPEMILDQYPTLPLAVIHKIIAFYLENRSEVDAYIAAHDQEVERQMAQPRNTPTLEELRKRFAARQQPGHAEGA